MAASLMMGSLTTTQSVSYRHGCRNTDTGQLSDCYRGMSTNMFAESHCTFVLTLLPTESMGAVVLKQPVVVSPICM